ncbi:MAG: hypothetical protein LBH32_04245 [Dysgonamonadaceae bacterium]|jgi:hypothetical protein|nr:hypothetical protein [Dysgonamonadaceae bacterium]
MKKIFIIILILNCVKWGGFNGFSGYVFSQNIVWNAGIYPFFQNTEFGYSKVQMPQTMAGVHVAPEIGLCWDKNRIFAGIDLMHEWGSNKAIDYSDVIAYYEYAGKPFRFYMGAFPRRMALEKYPRMFFQDSILNYRPVVNGLFWEFFHRKNYFNVWLDWTSRQTTSRHEAFFMGWSGRYNAGVMYGQHFGYMFHFAGKMNPEIEEGLHDNGLLLTSLGIDLASKTGFEKLEVNAGWSVGLERDRSIGDWHSPQGLLSEIKVEYRGLGLFNTYYRGESQQVFYGDHGNELYWGDPIYRSKEYNRTDFYLCFINTDAISLKLTYSLHFTEKTMYHEQALAASINLGKMKSKKTKNYKYIWSGWFDRFR